MFRYTTHIGAGLAIAALSTFASPTTLAAQEQEQNPFGPGGRFGVSVNALYGAPQEEFKQFVDRGWGLGGGLLVKIDPAGVLALRVDANFLNYGSERTRVPLGGTGGLIRLDLNTTHNIFMGGAGLQLQAPAGPLRPYVGGTVGFSTIWTQTTAEGTDNDDQPFAQSTNQRDNTFAWSGVGGFTVPLTRSGTVLMDLGVTYQGNGEATYLPPGIIRDENGDPIVRDPVRTTTDIFVYRLGVRIGF